MSLAQTAAARETAPPAVYWEERARRYAATGGGLKAVCSYGMPLLYNLAIDATQRFALRPFLRVTPGMRALDVGCGIGRWSRALARRGAEVTGVDLAPAMLAEARRRAERARLGARCRFVAGDVARLALGERFDLVLAVTVLQHVLDPDALDAALAGLRDHLAPGGRLVLLEAAPDADDRRCDSGVFHARTAAFYRDRFARAGLRVERVQPVDPIPLRTRLLPLRRRLWAPAADALLAAASLATLPAELLLVARERALGGSGKTAWHKVFELVAVPGSPPPPAAPEAAR